MKVDVKMPQLGESLTEGTILKWWKKVGDPVEKDETLLEVSTDKVDSEIPSPVGGVLAEILAQENETVPVGGVIARISTGGEEAVAPPEAPAQSAPETPKEVAPAPAPEAKPPAVPREETPRSGGRFYSPLVLTIARKEGVSMEELERISGSGANGRVTKKDILNYLKQRGAAPAPAPPASQPALSFDATGVTVEPLTPVLKSMAKHMRQSLDTAAHVYSVSECDMTPVMNLMAAMRPKFLEQEGFKLTVTPFIFYAVVKALHDFPRVNASLDGENLVYHKHVNLGMAVASPKGLIVPVIKHAEEKNFRGLARAINQLAARTRENRLTLEDIQGSTFSVTNFGVFGNVMGLPIINQPNVAILGIGAIKKRPVVIEDELGDSIAVRSMALLSLSFDHRVIDGEMGGRFLERVVGYLQNIKETEL